MLNERALIGRLEAADAEELAALMIGASFDEQRVLRLYLGSRTFQRLRSLALRRALRHKAGGKPNAQENVVVVPGIFGCELSSRDSQGHEEPIWLRARSIAAGHLARLRLDDSGRSEADPRYTIKATGVMKREYGELILTLAEYYNVHVFWYDWRKDIRTSAAQLQAQVNAWFGENAPVHFVAHSEGGLIVRSYIAHYPQSWNAHGDGKLIMLGTPVYGLYSVIQALTGQLEMIKWLDLLDTVQEETDIRAILHSFPSVYQLLPAPELGAGLEQLYELATYGASPTVSAVHLQAALEHHKTMSRAVGDPQRMVYIGGDNQPTLTGVNLAELLKNPKADVRRLYRIDLQGDGRVPHHLGVLRDSKGERIPAFLLKETNFGDLHKNPALLDALNDLLAANLRKDGWQQTVERYGLAAAQVDDEATGEPLSERELKRFWETLRQSRRTSHLSFRKLMRRLPTRTLPDETEAPYSVEDGALEESVIRHFSVVNVLGKDVAHTSLVRFGPPEITVGVAFGDITQVDALVPGEPPVDAISVGHYSGGKPEAALKAVDAAISAAFPQGPARSEEGRIIYQFTQRGTIKGELAQIFLLNDPRERGKALDRVIAVAGMGAPGRFGAPELAVLARELCWTAGRIGKKHLATTLIGAGVGNLTAPEAVAAWLRGVKFALTGIDTSRQPVLQALTFVEIDPDKAQEICDALQQEAVAYGERNRMRIILRLPDEKQVAAARAMWRRRQQSQREQDEDNEERAATRITVSLDGTTYRFGALTSDASIPQREIPLDPNLVRMANDEVAGEIDPQQQLLLGQFMERLLIPADLRSILAGSAPIVMMMDATTARIHWELMGQTTVAAGDALDEAEYYKHFWATSRGFTRQLRTAFAPPPEPPPPNRRLLRVLVVADPAADAPLPGAEEEGILVADLFEAFNLVHAASENRIEVVRLFGPGEATRTAVLRHLMMRSYDLLHFAGHCVYDAEDPANSGWIFTNGERLTAYELNRIDRVPKFIFSNACESGVTPIRSEKRSVDLAPSFAEIFFARGVANLVCTAWPVDDQAAREFALTLYANLLGMAPEEGQDGQEEAGEDAATNGAVDEDLGRLDRRIRYTKLKGGPQPMYRAMQLARYAIAQPERYDIRTWGAYQHYGNPYYRLFDVASLAAGEEQAAGEQEQAGEGTRGGSARRRRRLAAGETESAGAAEQAVLANGAGDQEASATPST